MEITKTEIYSSKITRDYTLAVVADLHNRKYDDVICAMKQIKPDYILIPGDLTNNLEFDWQLPNSENGIAFLSEATKIAKTYYSVGNHERRICSSCAEVVSKTGTVLLDDKTEKDGEITFGGLSTGLFESRYGPTPAPNLDYLAEFEKKDGFKLLLCHHPEYYPEYIKGRDIDLVISGHAHGGQWRVFGHGVYAPGQGFWPRYTAGLHENRLYVSRGLSNTAFHIPRFFNRTELAVIQLKKKDA